MSEHLIISLTMLLVLGVMAQWLAWRMNVPSILLFLLIGFIMGPVTGFLKPDLIFGDLLFPLVSFAVAIILFEGGLSLRIVDLQESGRAVRNLISLGTLSTWVISGLAAHYLLELNWNLAILFGSILVVTGPTVIIPLLIQIRPIGQVSTILRWEGIVIDPIGAILAVLVFEAIIAGELHELNLLTLIGFAKIIFVGGMVGVFAALLLYLLLKKHLVPDLLQNPFSLMMVILAFTLSNLLQTESGLVTVTVMGIVLANQKTVMVKHIVDFKESLRVLLISSLFIVLAARLEIPELLGYIHLKSLLFLGVLILIARPFSVMVSTIGTRLNWKEKLFLSWVAPRGIVAAAVSSIFTLRLVEEGHTQADSLVPLTFLVIVATVTIYGLTAFPLARWLGLSKPNPQGTLVVGGHPLARGIAKAIQTEGFQVLLVDSNWSNISEARMSGLPTHYANILSESVMDKINFGGLGRILAMTPNDEVNSLTVLYFSDIFGRSHVYQLQSERAARDYRDEAPLILRGRTLFGRGMTYKYLNQIYTAGGTIKTTHLTQEFTYTEFKEIYGKNAICLFLITETKEIQVFTEEINLTPHPGQILISLVNVEQ